MLRLIIRSWREITDGIRAGAAHWERRWTASDVGNPLARRLCFNYATSYYATKDGWRVRTVLQWLRLVRTEKIRRQRKRSNIWRTTEQNRLQQLYDHYRARALTTRTPQIYTWSAQEQVSATAGVSSGAATVIHKRGRDSTSLGCHSQHLHGTTAQRPRKRPAAAASPPEPTRERRVDSQLIYDTNAHRLYVARI